MSDQNQTNDPLPEPDDGRSKLPRSEGVDNTSVDGRATAAGVRQIAEAERRLSELQAKQRHAARPLLRGRDWMGFVVLGGLMAFGWAWTFQEMWVRWFERWHRTELTLMQRLTEGNSYYTHAPLVPLACLVIAFYIYRRVGFPADDPDRKPSPGKSLWEMRRLGRTLGWVVLGGSLFMHLLASVSGVMFVSGFSLIGVIAGLVLVWGGWPLFRAYWVPVVLLVFMVPLPELAIARLNFELKGVASDGAMWISTQLFQIPAFRTGSFVHLPPDVAGDEPKMLVVENVCSGLRSLISLTFFASMFALVCRVRGLWRVVLLLLAVPVAVVTNVIRIAGLIVVAHHHGVEHTSEGAAFHDYSGLLVFVLALAILFALEYTIIGLGKLTGRNWVDERLMGFIERIRPDPGASARVLRPSLVCVLALVTALSFYYIYQPGRAHSGDVAGRAVEREAVFAGVRYQSFDLPLSQQAQDILQTDDYLYRIFDAGDNHPRIDLLIVFSPNNRKGTHPPEVCLEGEGHQMLRQSNSRIDVEGLGPLVFRELVTQRGRQTNLFVYIYRAGSGYTPSFFRQQVSIFSRAMLGGDAAGALIRLSTPIVNDDYQAARRLLDDAVSTLMPSIDKGLNTASDHREVTSTTIEAVGR
ncbi:MAG: EpsI family protein [Phycisphaeraceae bacterium]|nr:EpsI family protein [Phycisphaeraceae bacterium]